MSADRSEGYDDILAELVRDPTTLSVWLMGSRVNGTANDDSDWDLLWFRSLDPSPSDRRCEHVDVIAVGPSGRVLLEGQPEVMSFDFSDFNWRSDGDRHATYLGKKMLDFEDGAVRDSDAPAVERKWQRAVKLWP